MKRLLVVLLVLGVWQAQGQEQQAERTAKPPRTLRAVEGEFSWGASYPIHGLGDKCLIDPRMWRIETRYNFAHIPLDVGLLLKAQYLTRKRENPAEYLPGRYEDKRFIISTWQTMAVADYNFRREQKVSFFVGLAAGCGSEDGWDEDRVYINSCVMPRCGVELWNRLRVTLSYTYMRKNYSNLGMSLGIVVGGGHKR